MGTFLIVVHVITCVLLVFVVLIQSGKDGGVGAMAGGSQTVFGSSGGANFFTRFTSALAAVFMVTSITLTILKSGGKTSIFDGASPAAKPTAAAPSSAEPAAPAPPTAPQKK